MERSRPALEQVSLVIGNRIGEFSRVAAALDALAQRHGLPDAALDMHVALDEVLSNIVKYAYDDAARHEIRIRLTAASDRLEAEVEDDGKAFDPLLASQRDPSVPLTRREPGGLGVSVVKRLMSAVSYRRGDGRNRLTLIRRFDR